MPINKHTLVRPCLTLRCRCPYIMLASLSNVIHDFTNSWIDWLLKSIVHDIFHFTPSGFQPPLVHSLVGLAIWTYFITRPLIFFLFLVLIFQECRPCMNLALPGSDIYKHRLAEKSPRNTHYAHSTPIRNFNDMKALWKWTSRDLSWVACEVCQTDKRDPLDDNPYKFWQIFHPKKIILPKKKHPF